jgi:hypothetical protein
MGIPVAGLALLIGLKIGLDVLAHAKQHALAGKPALPMAARDQGGYK